MNSLSRFLLLDMEKAFVKDAIVKKNQKIFYGKVIRSSSPILIFWSNSFWNCSISICISHWVRTMFTIFLLKRSTSVLSGMCSMVIWRDLCLLWQVNFNWALFVPNQSLVIYRCWRLIDSCGVWMRVRVCVLSSRVLRRLIMRTHGHSFKSRKGGNVHASPSVCLFQCLLLSLFANSEIVPD